MTIANAAVKLNLAWRRNHRSGRRLPVLFLLSDPVRLPDPIPYLDRLPRGSAVIYRCYDAAEAAAARHGRALRLRAACRARGLRLLIAGDDRLAAAIRADGIHLSEWRLARGAWRRGPMRARGGLVTAACHGKAAIARAARAGVDAILLAPVFPTASHPETPTLGPLRFASLARRSPVPVFALGGVGPATIARLRGTGAAGIAAIGALIAGRD